MTDIEDLFRTSVNQEHRGPGAVSTASRPDDEDVLDLTELVQSWNREHDQDQRQERQGGRLAHARQAWSQRIGSHPDHQVEPPPRGVELPDWREGHRAREATGTPEDLPSRSWLERRRDRREMDRLQRSVARRGPIELDEPDEPDVRILGPTRSGEAAATTVQPEPAPEPDPEPARPGWRERRRARKVDAREARAQERGRRAEARGQVRFPILTRSILVWMFIFLLGGLAFGASAAFWWSHFSQEVDALRAETTTFTDQVEGASDAIATQREDAMTEIDEALDVFGRIAGAPETVAAAGEYAESVWFVETMDQEGAPSVGSAFVVGSDGEQSLLVTSLEVVEAATVTPGPEITIRSGDRALPAELWSWDVELDLALLTVGEADLPALEWAEDEAAASALGSGIVVLGGLGGAGASASPGLVVDQSAAGLQHTAPVGAGYRGGPIMTGDGTVLGVASLAYQPLGFDPGEVRFAVPVSEACRSILVCGASANRAPGASGGEPVEGQTSA